MSKLRRLSKLEMLRVLLARFAMGFVAASSGVVFVLLSEAYLGRIALGAAIILAFIVPLAPAFTLRQDTWAIRIGASVCALFGSFFALIVIATWIEAAHQA